MYGPTSPLKGTHRGPGRPRSSEADTAIVEATLAILVEHGYAGLTMESVAERAGVGKATLYRRYPSKTSLIAGTARTVMQERAQVPDTGAAARDVALLLHNAATVLQHGPWGEVLRAVVGEASSDPDVEQQRRAFWRTRSGELAAIADRGIARGELREDLDRDLFADLVLGPIYFRLLVSGAELTPTVVDRIVPGVLDGLRRR